MTKRESEIKQMNGDISPNQALISAGIKTVRVGETAFLERNGISVRRPHVENSAYVCLLAFNVVI